MTTEVYERYTKRFGNMPPLVCWAGSTEDLDKLMEEALVRGRVLTRTIF